MSLSYLQMGDIVYAAVDIHNDDEGGIPVLEAGELIATAGTRGVVVNIGHAEEDPKQKLLLVRFELPDSSLGAPTGCLPEEIATEKPVFGSRE
ncbi:nitrogen fixation protein NifZ [Beggiatoa leptomitoformis]|uniref:Nitrogen fixation protein NifZ n=1 Tax=Beggiatoa leptomitoformis TaxID=288004 RepID=A0A2N9YIR2_9GAMM|nr:nitrogen fixation protein NifZ [Beggiatoa leptomitoformis]ALG67414.1 nitrogen fixation protein NifZ [Beggiatoa leptomitoformis]AUI70373.1 nitrogen fixation protein NifZ [Beggiatoa leptomitoformis]